MILVSPTERQPVASLGRTSSTPERYGCDLFWVVRRNGPLDGLWGIQRKTVADLFASLHDDRLAKELHQMAPVDHKYLILEGNPQFTPDGLLLVDTRRGRHTKPPRPITRDQLTGIQFSLTANGVHILHAADQLETCRTVAHLHDWSRKTTHSLLRARSAPGPRGPIWGMAASKPDLWAWVLQSLPDVGEVTAKAIVAAAAPNAPVAWTMDRTALLGVKGVGKKTADRLIGLLT